MGHQCQKCTGKWFFSQSACFRENPNFPNVMSVKSPALEGVTQSELIAKNLNAMHAARKAFIQQEPSEKIRRALRHQIRT